MLKASALYIVIIIAVVIAIFSGTLISTAFFYKLEYQKNLRYANLASNLESGKALLLSESFAASKQDVLIDLFGEGKDSLLLRNEAWGAFDIGTVKSFIQRDTLKKAFLIADKQKNQLALYLSDEDRPLSVSGETRITGDVQIPKAGIKQAYVEGKPYTGNKMVYDGAIKDSGRQLPTLNEDRIAALNTLLADTAAKAGRLNGNIKNSFFNEAHIVRLKKATEISQLSLDGKIILISDTTIRIKSDAVLNNILVLAPAIVVESGFKGVCQLFASDSVMLGNNVRLEYPSCAGILKPAGSKIQARIDIGAGSLVEGTLFTHEKSRSDLQTIISLGKGCLVRGEIYSTGYIKLQKPVKIEGSALCNRFIIQTPTTLYENYLIDITINRRTLNPYYLSAFMRPSDKINKQVLKWLD